MSQKDKEVQLEKKITAKRVLITSFLVDLLDIVLNFTIAVISGSVIMLTQVFEAIADLTASGFLLIGHRRSMRKEDKTHPFGYGREIYFWTLLSALIMFGLTSTLSFYFGWKRFLAPEALHDVNLALLVLVITFFTNFYAFALSYRRLLRRRSPRHIMEIFYRSSLVETKTTFILDMMGSLASLLGIIALVIYVATGDHRLDGLGAMAIGIALAISSIFLLLGIRDLLIGKSASLATEEKIKKAAMKIPEVEGVLDLKTLHVGSEKLLVNLEVHMVNNLSTDELEELIDKIKENIKLEVPSVKYLQVELETPDII
ncbi:MAG: cation diffusion facilitator family transporter [Patescibacteria group bacterium]